MLVGWIVVVTVTAWVATTDKPAESTADLVFLASGWIAAGVVVVAWICERYQKVDLKDIKDLAGRVKTLLEAAGSVPEIRKRIDTLWLNDIKPKLDSFMKSLLGPGTDTEAISRTLTAWGIEPWDKPLAGYAEAPAPAEEGPPEEPEKEEP